MVRQQLERRFAPPALPPRHVSRRRLLDRLLLGLAPEKRVTLAIAGPGTGKTTLLAEYAGHERERSLWINLTPSDREPTRLLEALAGGLQERLPGLGSLAPDFVRTLGPDSLAQAAGLLCDQLAAIEDPLILVLDRLECWPAGASAAGALETLVHLFPEQHQLALSGRGLPAIRLAQLKLQDRAVVLDDGDLAFTEEEIAALAREVGAARMDPPAPLDPEADPPAVEQVLARTRGWATGVVYALGGGQGEATRRLERPELLYEFLAQEAFQALPESFQQQLLVCAYLPRLEPSTCRALFGPDADPFLSRLAEYPTIAASVESSEPATARRAPAARTVLELHPLYREFLQREIQTRWPRAAREDLFHRLAWHAAATPEEAVAYLQLAADWERAEERLVTACPELFKSGRVTTIQGLIDEFPAAWRRESPWLRYLEGELARRAGDLGRSLDLLETAARLADERQARRTLGWVTASLAAACGARGDTERQRQEAQRAMELLAEGDPWPQALCRNALGMYHVYRHDLAAAKESFQQALALFQRVEDAGGGALVLLNLGLCHAKAGHFDRAIAAYRESVRLAEAGGRLPQALCYNNLALAHHHLGQRAEAWQAAEQGMALAERTAARRDRIALLRTLGILILHDGRPGEARELFEASLDEALRAGDRYSETQARIRLAEVALREGDPSGAQAALDRAAELAGGPLEAVHGSEGAMLQVEIALARGDPERAEALLADLGTRDRVAEPHFAFLLSRLQVLLATARGDETGAAPAREEMLRLARDHGYAMEAPDGPGVGAAGHAVAVSPAGPQAAVEVNCLGSPFEARVEGRPIAQREWKSANARILLVYLLGHPQGASKETLQELLFPHDDPNRSAVHVIVNRLRQALEPRAGKGAPSRFVLFQEGRYLFNRGIPTRFDLGEFRRMAQQACGAEVVAPAARSALLDQAIALYRGPFLQEVSDLPWCLLERENVRRLAVKVYEARFALAADADDWPTILRLAEALLASEPHEEAAIQAKVAALAMQDRLAEALRFGRLATELREREGGLPPGEDTADLLERLAGGRVTVRELREVFRG